MKIAQISDLHLTSDTTFTKNGINPYASLLSVLKHMKHNYPEITDIVVTGDISNDETQKSYQNLYDALIEIGVKYSIWLPGNHDSESIINSFDSNGNKLQNPIVSTFTKHSESLGDAIHLIDNTEWIILLINTKLDGSVAGQVDDNELDNLFSLLEKQEYQSINARSKNNIIIFMHHPLVEVQSNWIDKVCIKNKESVIKKLSTLDDIRAVFCGHVHQEYSTKIGKINYFTTPSTCYQFKPRAEAFEIDFNSAPGYRIIDLNNNNFSTFIVRI